MSGNWATFTGTDYISFTAGGAGAAGTGAHTIAVLWKSSQFNPNSGLVDLFAGATGLRNLHADGGELFGAGDFSVGYPTNAVANDTWDVGAISKPPGSAHYRLHLWPYASNGSGVMLHGEAADAANHGDGSAITEIRIGMNGWGLIAAVGIWNSALSDANLDTLKSPNLSAWAALSPAELIHLKDWDGTNGSSATRAVGSSAFSSLTGAVGVGANPPGFNFSLGGGAPVQAGAMAMFF